MSTTKTAHQGAKPAPRAPHSNHKRRKPPPALRRRVAIWPWVAVLAAVAAVGGMVLLGRSPGRGAHAEGIGTTAPAFTLTSTVGKSVSLSSFRGRDVLLYFSEGVGCDTCFYQMGELEKNASQLTAKGLTVLPIVVNPASDVRREMARFGLKTPFLIDGDESVSNAYGVIGTGMHENLPGHSFVLVDGSGRIRWRKDYPSMFVTVPQLLADMGS